jgi:hypothetical protein
MIGSMLGRLSGFSHLIGSLFERFCRFSGLDVYTKFPGLFAARYARDKGYRDRQVIVYSVFQDAEVQKEIALLNCTYIIKGRPKAFKDELEEVLAYDPTRKA